MYLRFVPGGAYDTVPEVSILLSLFNFSDKFYPVVFDEAGTHILSCAHFLHHAN